MRGFACSPSTEPWVLRDIIPYTRDLGNTVIIISAVNLYLKNYCTGKDNLSLWS